MTDHDRELIEATVKATIRELTRAGLIKAPPDTAYKEATAALRRFYEGGETDARVKTAIETIKEDKYYKIIPLYFSYHYTIEEIAEVFDVEISTVSRNKKRLSIKIYESL